MNADVALEVADSHGYFESDWVCRPAGADRDKSALRDTLLHTYETAERLNLEQLDRFNSQMLGLLP